MSFWPAISIPLSDARAPGVCVQRGQWVEHDGVKGRVIDPSSLFVLWRFAGERFASFNLRFSRALIALRRVARRVRRFVQLAFDFCSSLVVDSREVAPPAFFVPSPVVRLLRGNHSGLLSSVYGPALYWRIRAMPERLRFLGRRLLCVR